MGVNDMQITCKTFVVSPFLIGGGKRRRLLSLLPFTSYFEFIADDYQVRESIRDSRGLSPNLKMLGHSVRLRPSQPMNKKKRLCHHSQLFDGRPF